jgi:hypothetical protein
MNENHPKNTKLRLPKSKKAVIHNPEPVVELDTIITEIENQNKVLGKIIDYISSKSDMRKTKPDQ